MRVLVTGAAGFIGSHLCERLVADEHKVVGIDRRFTQNLNSLFDGINFSLVRADLLNTNLTELLDGCDAVLHLAARAGTAQSWNAFSSYVDDNIIAAQKLLEAVVLVGGIPFVHVSSSSVYGLRAIGQEDSGKYPVSPYGVTKLAAENLCRAYLHDKLAIIRPFSVYGPRQRPDMYHHIFIKQVLNRDTITIEGDGQQTRSNTYVTDVVDAMVKAMDWVVNGGGGTRDTAAFNVGGDVVMSINDTIYKIEQIIGHVVPFKTAPPRRGDQRETQADYSHAKALLNWEPKVGIMGGLCNQIEYQREVLHHGTG